MSAFEENIQKWIVSETNGLIEGRLKKLPNVALISRLTQGKNKKIWKFVAKYVRSKQSVSFIKKVLQIRRIKKEREEYEDTIMKSYVILKNKIDCFEDKIRFTDNSVKSITKHLFSLNATVKDKNDENCILQQKCSILELISLSLKEKNDSLSIIFIKLLDLFNKSFANEKTKYFKNMNDTKLSKNFNKVSQNLSDYNLESIINEMISILERKLFNENLNSPVTNLAASVTAIMSCTPTIDIVRQLKHLCQQDFNFLQNNIEKLKEEDIKRISETYMQSMKQDFQDSCFQRKKMECSEKPFEINDMHFNKEIGKLQKDYLILYIQNECLAISIQYLEKQLTCELDLIKNLKEDNVHQKSQCQDIEAIIKDFYEKLNTVHLLFDLMPKSSLGIASSSETCKMFIKAEILPAIKYNEDDCLIDVVSKIDCNYKLYLELLKNKEFLQDFLMDFTFIKQNFPVKVWEFLAFEPFHDKHLLVEKLSRLKAKLSTVPNRFCYEQDEIPILTIKQMISSIKYNTDHLEVLEKNLYKVRKDCTALEVVLKDWWNQGAQYIPKIEHHGKTLKMWLAILNVLE